MGNGGTKSKEGEQNFETYVFEICSQVIIFSLFFLFFTFEVYNGIVKNEGNFAFSSTKYTRISY